MQGVHSYDILASPLYNDGMQYIACNVPNRADYIIDDDYDEENDEEQSDFVRAVLNLAYFDEDRAKDFSTKSLYRAGFL